VHENDILTVTFLKGTPQAKLTFNNKASSFYVIVQHDKLAEVKSDDEQDVIQSYSLEDLEWEPECSFTRNVNNSLTETISFSSILPNKATISLSCSLYDFPAPFREGEDTVILANQSFLAEIRLKGWNGTETGRPRYYMTTLTTASVFDMALPSYYPDGNVRDFRISRGEADIVIHAADNCTVTTYSSNNSSKNGTVEYEGLSIQFEANAYVFPITADLTFTFSHSLFSNQSLYYAFATELQAPSDVEINWVLILVGAGIGLVSFLSLVILLGYFIKKQGGCRALCDGKQKSSVLSSVPTENEDVFGTVFPDSPRTKRKKEAARQDVHLNEVSEHEDDALLDHS